jgi:hypothetical protein
MIVNGTLIRDLGTDKFIPVLRQGSLSRRVPTALSTRLNIDFSDDKEYGTRLEELLRELHDVPLARRPSLGQSPFRREGDS